MSDVGVDKFDTGGVGTVVQDGRDDLVHGGDSGSTSDHAERANEAWAVSELALGTSDVNGVTDFELSDMLRDVPLVVALWNRVRWK